MSDTLPGAKIDNVESMLAKSGVAFTEGAAVVGTTTDGMVDMPAGAAALIFFGVCLETKTGDGTKRIQVATAGERVPMVASEAMQPGDRVEIHGTGGKVRKLTVEGAVIGRAVTNAAGDGKRVYVRIGGGA